MDSLIRKVIYLWVAFMYFGQATKDVLCIPRPLSPPGIKILYKLIKSEYYTNIIFKIPFYNLIQIFTNIILILSDNKFSL